MPHSDECIHKLYELGLPQEKFCIGGCSFTREELPGLWDLLIGSGDGELRSDRNMPIFEVTEDHHKLLKRMFWQWDDQAYDGAPCVGIKRPYGNSDTTGDVAEILGWEDVHDEDGYMNPAAEERALKIHREMDTVLQILTCTLSIPLGVYEKAREYDSLSWEKVDG